MTTHISQSLTGVMTAEDRFPDNVETVTGNCP